MGQHGSNMGFYYSIREWMGGWVGWRAYRYQIIQELEKLFGREESFGVLFLHFGLGVLVICPLSPLYVFLFLVKPHSLALRFFGHLWIVFWEIIRVRVKIRSLGISDRTSRVARPAACFAFCAALLLLRYYGIYRKSFLASLHFFFWCVVHALLAAGLRGA